MQPCMHEQELGKIISDLATAYKHIDTLRAHCGKLDVNIDNLREQNVAVIKLNITLENLVTAVKEANEEFRVLLASHDKRLTEIEQAEGNRLKEIKALSVNNFFAKLAQAIGIGVIGYIVAIVSVGGG